MPGDPNQCREHAAHCRQLAANAPNELVAENFSNLALTWERLAAELQSTETLLGAMYQLAADDFARDDGCGHAPPRRETIQLGVGYSGLTLVPGGQTFLGWVFLGAKSISRNLATSPASPLARSCKC
jgi:hypothetical protein